MRTRIANAQAAARAFAASETRSRSKAAIAGSGRASAGLGVGQEPSVLRLAPSPRGELGGGRKRNGPAGRSRSDIPGRASGRRCARSETRACAASCRATSTPGKDETSTASWPCWSRMRPAPYRHSRTGSAVARWSSAQQGNPGCSRSRRANGQPAFASYMWDARRERYLPTSLEVLTLEGERMKDITAFVSPELPPRLGLPAELSRSGGAEYVRTHQVTRAAARVGGASGHPPARTQ
jgi:hypothetical protein